MHRVLRHLVIFVLITVGLLVVVHSVREDTAPKAVKYSEFLQLMDSGSVAEVLIESSGTKLIGTYKSPEKGAPAKFFTNFRPDMDPSPERQVELRGIQIGRAHV